MTLKKLLFSILFSPTLIYAAQPIDLSKLPSFSMNFTQSLPTEVKEISKQYDGNQTLHVRIKQYYKGYPVWQGNGIFHYPKSVNEQIRNSANGVLYKNLAQDLGEKPAFNKFATEKAEATASLQCEKKYRTNVTEKKSTAVIYLDAKQKAHWAYLVELYIQSSKGVAPQAPTFMIDAITQEIYREWNNIDSLNDEVYASGYGGNFNTGKYIYDGKPGNLNALLITRDAAKNTCYMENKEFVVVRFVAPHTREVISFPCAVKNTDHNLTFWHDESMVNGAYSISNDVFSNALTTIDMYHKWYHQELSGKDHRQYFYLIGIIDENIDNAYFDKSRFHWVFGNGGKKYYPFISLDVVAHELSHAVTHFYSDLESYGQAAGIKEAFSDMGAITANFYAKRPISWALGTEISKDKTPIRYMDKPSRDCGNRYPGWFCSIDRAEQYGKFGLTITDHQAAGVYNRFFYILSNTAGWNIKKAFDVMMQANRFYWTAGETFQTAACGVYKAAHDLTRKDPGYKVQDVRWAFREVGIEVDDCSI